MFTFKVGFLFQVLELLTSLMNRLSIAKNSAKMGMLRYSIIRIFEHVLYGNPPQTINQWIAAQGGWVRVTVILYAYFVFLKKQPSLFQKSYHFTLNMVSSSLHLCQNQAYVRHALMLKKGKRAQF